MILSEKQTAENPLASLVKNYARYNVWANAQIINWLRTKPHNLITQEVASSFPSLRLTLIHIMDCQKFWLSAIKRKSFRGEVFTGTNEELFGSLIGQSEELADYLHDLPVRALTENCELNTPWFSSDFQIFEYVQQVLNHSTYHRGQIVTIGRQLGFTDAPMTDYNLYNIIRNK